MKQEILHWDQNEKILIILSRGLQLHKTIMRYCTCYVLYWTYELFKCLVKESIRNHGWLIQESDKENILRLCSAKEQFLNSHVLALLYDWRENTLLDFLLCCVFVLLSVGSRNMEVPLARVRVISGKTLTQIPHKLSSWSQNAFVTAHLDRRTFVSFIVLCLTMKTLCNFASLTW